MRTVCGLDIHKDSIFMCILDSQGEKSEEKFGVSTRDVKRLSACLQEGYVTEVCMVSTKRVSIGYPFGAYLRKTFIYYW